jgi:hypothetical protein
MSNVQKASDRVSQHTPDHVNERIRRRTDMSIEYYAHHSELIDQRLKELDEEWDIERTLETNASSLVLTGLALSMLASRKWLMLPIAVAGFLLQHGVQGWCPPLPLFRRLGVRTKDEILRERAALLAIKGDLLRSRGSDDKSLDDRVERVVNTF